MKHLHIDIETYSEVSIADSGAYKYAMDPSFMILLVAYACDDEPTQVVDLAKGEKLPASFLEALTDPKVTKHAHNATFERVCFTMLLRRSSLIGPEEWLGPRQWDCSMIQAARCGLPMSLKQVGEALHLDEQKMAEGKALIQLFCVPNRKTGRRVLPEEHPDKWETFKAYCVRDVDVERAIGRELLWYEVSEFERELYAIDQTINDRGVLVDVEMARKAADIDAKHNARLAAEAVTITGLSNPNSPTQLRQWLGEQLGMEVAKLTKTDLPDLRKAAEGKPFVQRILRIREEMGKTSNAKYTAMLDVAAEDGRARGLTQFYGSRTGRWAGRLIQMQNLPQNHIEALDQARQMLREGDYDSIELCFGNVPDTMSQLIRTAFIPSEGKIFAVCDFSAIEARVLAWMAGEDWVLDVFRKGGDIYCATASQMFKVPVEKHGQNAHLRQKGKVAVLALGYQGGVGALDKMGGARMGMTEHEETQTVNMWRNANPNIVALWGMLEKAAKECAVYGATRQITTKYCTLTFRMEGSTMTISLPSGRKICYPGVEVKDGKLRFMGMNQTTHKWEWVDTYGGKITENITQAIARDCLAETMIRCEAAGYKVVFHIHDEIVMEVPDENSLYDIEEIFKQAPSWAVSLPLKGAGYTGKYYFKD